VVMDALFTELACEVARTKEWGNRGSQAEKESGRLLTTESVGMKE